MKKWYSIYDEVKFALSIYMIGLLMAGIANVFTANTAFFRIVLIIFKYTGNLIVQLYPLMIVINAVGIKHQSSVPTATAIICYVLFNIVTMFTANQSYASGYYLRLMGMSINMADFGESTLIRYPLNGGIITSIIVIIIANNNYRRSRKRMNYGILNFISNDSWFFVCAIIETVAFAICFSYMYGYFVTGLDWLLKLISTNKTKPVSMAAYSFTEKVLELLGLGQITKDYFWFGALGGNYLSNTGSTVLGDINIWTNQYAAENIGKGVGRFVTGYLPMNNIIVPVFAIVIALQGNNRIEKQKIIGVALVAVIISMIAGTLLPLEMFLAITAPVLLCFHLAASSAMSGIIEYNRLYLGHSYTGIEKYALPGSIKDLLTYLNRLDFYHIAIRIVIIGACFAAAYALFTFVYYHFLASDFLSRKKKRNKIEQMLKAFGGIENIKFVKSSLNSIQIAFFDEDLINKKNILKETAVYKIIESAYGYDMKIGPGSIIYCNMLNKEIKKNA